MVLHPMYVHVDEPERTIGFEVSLESQAVSEHLRMIQFITVKFDGERRAVSRTTREEHHPYGTNSVRFLAETFEADARFCDEQIMENGSPEHDFHHELEHAGLSDAVDNDLHWEMSGQPDNPYRMVKA